MSALPEDLSAALDAAGLSDFFAGCTPAHQREYLQWITSAKRPDTRQARIQKAIKMIADKSAQERARAQKPSRRPP